MISFESGQRIFTENHLEYSKELHEKLEIYCDFLVEYNKNVNLTAITVPEEVWLKHFADSILLLNYVDIPKNSSLIDVGTGAGFPSIPIKLYRDDIQLTMLDSLNKRIIFLENLCERIGIKAEAVHGRAEEYGKKEAFREQFDVATARAVAPMPVLSEYCMPFVKKGGVFAAMKGPNEDAGNAENAVKILGGDGISVYDYLLGKDDRRKIFSVKKISQTPTKYPRNSGQIKNKAL
jgi:16S rRNA (guanine527-N7)-methyltransferase